MGLSIISTETRMRWTGLRSVDTTVCPTSFLLLDQDESGNAIGLVERE